MEFRARTPLRISFAGGGTDVSPYSDRYGGAVLCCTIDKFAYSSLMPNKTNTIKLHAKDLKIKEILRTKGKAFDLEYGKGPDLLKSMIKIMNPRKKGFEIMTWCEVPPGSGLGASSAMMISQISSLSEYLGKKLPTYELANLAYKIEREELKIKGGLQDQYACTFGGFNFIEFKGKSATVTPLRLPNEIINELSSSLLLFDTKITRSSSKIISSQIKNYDSDKVKNVLDGMKQLAYEAKKLIIKGDLIRFGELLDESWNLKKTVEKTISNQRINKIYNNAKKIGCIGGKILGAGGGGHLLLFVNPEKKTDILKKMESFNCKNVPFSFFPNGTQSWRVKNGTVEF